MDDYSIVSVLRAIKDISSKGRGFLFSKRFVRNSGINIDNYGFATYKGPKEVEKFIDDMLEYNALIKEVRNRSLLGKMSVYILAIPKPFNEDVLLYLKERLPENPSPESIDELFNEIEKSIDDNIKHKLHRIYYEQLPLRNS